MRVGIDYSFVKLGRRALKRGICRYTNRQLIEVLRQDARNEYVLLCPEGTDSTLIPPEIRSRANVTLREGPARAVTPGQDPNAPGTLLRLAAEHQDWVRRERIDLYHATTPVLVELSAFPHWDVCPMVATFYDAIPLLYPDQYLPEPGARDTYARGLGFLQSATRLLAISESARKDASLHLGIRAEKIDVAPPAAEACFRPLAEEEIGVTLRGLRQRVHLPSRYALAVVAVHHSKNLDTLFRAYSLLDPRLRELLPLVVCCDLDGPPHARLRTLVDAAGVADDVVATGFVSDDELAALYNAATMVLHPSRHEGFGLPVLEAMHCGKPVIAARAGGLPEVGGEAVLLLDPGDAEVWARAIEELYRDPDRRREMGERGRAQAAKFPPRRLGEATLAAYGRAAACPRGTAGSRRRVAVWTPLPPQASGVADYSLELLDELRGGCDLEIFVDDGVLPSPALLARYAVHHFRAFPRRHALAPFDAIVYQVGTSPFHLYMQDALREWPGIVVLHDLAWSYIRYWHRQQSGDEAGFEGELRALEGEEAVREYRAIASGIGAHRTLDAFFDDHPMLGEVVARSRAQIVLLESVGGELQRRYPKARPYLVPMGVADPYRGRPDLESCQARSSLGIGSGTFVVGALGILAATKRLASCVRAFREVVDQHEDSLLLFVGLCYEPAFQQELADLAGQLGVGSRVRFTGHVPAPEFRAHLLSCDVVLSLRYPCKKELSASLMRGIAAGKPVVVSDLPEWSHLPREFCWRVPTGATEVGVLAAQLRVLAADPQLRASMGARAREYFEEHGTVQRMASEYLRIIDAVCAPAAMTA
jgi:glycosyltransferase involved in cell wall biosynthesis